MIQPWIEYTSFPSIIIGWVEVVTRGEDETGEGVVESVAIESKKESSSRGTCGPGEEVEDKCGISLQGRHSEFKKDGEGKESEVLTLEELETHS